MPWHFLVFNFNPEIVEKFSRILIHSIIDTLFFKVKVESSTYCKIQYSLVPIFMPEIILFFFISQANISIAKTNKRAETGQPCLMPLFIKTSCEIHPLFLTQNKGLL